MYTKEQLKKAGVTPEKIKPLAEGVDTSSLDSKFRKWRDREAARIQDGTDYNLRNWRLWWALDQAYDAPFHQVSFTLLKDILSKDYDDEKVNSLVSDFGLTHMLEPVLRADGTADVDGHGVAKKTLNIPVFFEIFVPLCMAYHKARWAKLFNDRNLVPLYKYEPAYSTQDNRLRCDIITNRISVMANQFGYASDEKDSIFQALHYGQSIAFPREAWHVDYRLGKDGEREVEREGLRFNMPPPERTYVDMSERLSTMNSQSGLAFAGYWHIAKLGDVKANDWWNKDKISYGDDVNIIKAHPNFFSNIYPCQLQFPSIVQENENDRESTYAAYASAEDDAAVILTEHFTTVVPKDVGIGDFEYPVTFRMVMMNYSTIAYIEPIYCAMGAYYGYDADGNRARNSSLTLEIMPFQDHLGNILTNWISAAKQNLIAPTFYDESIVPKQAIDQLRNTGHKAVAGRQFINFNSADMRAKLAEQREAFYSPSFPLLPSGEMQQLIRGLLDLLERSLGFSSQEIGQAASHEQSATESNIINNNIGGRVQFTGSFIDEGQWAKKRMLYDAWMACGDNDIMAEVWPNYTASYDEFVKLCKKLEIEVVDRAGTMGDRAVVKVPSSKKHHLRIETFVANRDNTNRINNQGIATAAVQLLTGFASNPALFAAVGPEQVVELTNQVADLLQLPKDFRLKFNPKSMAAAQQGQQDPQMVQQVQKQIQQLADEIGKRIEQGEQGVQEAIQAGDQQVAQGIAKEVGPVLQDQAKKTQELEQGLVELGKAVQQLGAGQQQIAQVLQQAQQQAPAPAPA